MKRIKKIIVSVIVIASILQLFQNAVLAQETENDVFKGMLERAEAIVNYEWIPIQDIDVWNENPYNGKMIFPAGEPVKGMPYTLFSWEFGVDSLLSFEQFKKKVSINTSTTAYCNSVSAIRTGPVYGSCCATFVSEVLGGSFMRDGNPRYDNCGGIEDSIYGETSYNVRMSDLRLGDAVLNTNRGHVIWVGNIDDYGITIYEQTPPVARKVIIPKTSVTSEGYMYYGGSTYNIVTRSRELLGNCDEQYTRSDKYPLPIKAYTLNTGKTFVYDAVDGNAKANKIYDTDVCTITKIYENGWCYVSFPLDVGGTDSGYVRISVFFDFDVPIQCMRTTTQLNTFGRENSDEIIDYIDSDSEVFLISETTDKAQIIFPLPNGDYEIGWVQKDDSTFVPLIDSYLLGDINGDGVVNNKDLNRLMKFLAGDDVEVIVSALDINEDGIVNNKDLTHLMKNLAE